MRVEMCDLRPAPRSARLSSLVQAFELQGELPGDLRVTGVSVDSLDIAPGELFVALPGFKSHGAQYAAQAVAAGARAIVTDEAGAALCAAAGVEAPVLLCADPRAVVGPLASAVYGHPAAEMLTGAVTGTNGKTTTSYFWAAILAAHCGDCVVAGTVELKVGQISVESPRTTVEAPVLQRLLRLGREEGVRAAALEASSHAIDLHRLAGIRFDVVGFTNLQRDHLDYHETMDQYLQAKAALFTPAAAARGVVCVDDSYGQRLAAQAAIPVQTLRAYDGPQEADWTVHDEQVSLEEAASTFTLRGPQGQELAAACPLPGRVNIQNAALAIVMALNVGIPAPTALRAVASAHNIPGRMQRISQRDGTRALCIVDFAHTPDALRLALQAIRPITPGRIIIVFGSDGDRDQGKRPMLGQVAAELADVLVVTDENPRSEDPATIRQAVLGGVRQVRPDLAGVYEANSRAEAVRQAVQLANPDDTVIVTGKGHEPYQEIAGVFHRYNDAPVLREAVAEKWGEA
ncbi:UDP-N-acetylmuramoyl-L-alanyl-D-glutamate--2,6-diaminopimelate ligase [Buchananella hordeovulneris]|uniref:UDP-N-acetylmuramoyl-L-alanyl-D-glutamate--2, 6-diaminopimelate ligase n=1 Tax=Buchananella hordeovulneris TaxID=52770 RepID=UPI000A00C55E